MFVFWIIAKSAVFSIIVVSRTEIPGIYTVWMVINCLLFILSVNLGHRVAEERLGPKETGLIVTVL